MYEPSVFSLVMWIFIPSGTIGAISSSALKNCVLFVMSRESLRGVSPAVSSARADLHPVMRTGRCPSSSRNVIFAPAPESSSNSSAIGRRFICAEQWIS